MSSLPRKKKTHEELSISSQAVENQWAKMPTMLIENGIMARQLREQLGMNQTAFWSRVFVNQSSGSRYELQRDIPKTILALLNLVYASDKQAAKILFTMRPNLGEGNFE